MNNKKLNVAAIEVDVLNAETLLGVNEALKHLLAEEKRMKMLSNEVSKASNKFTTAICQIADAYNYPRRKLMYKALQVLMDVVVMDAVTDLNLDTGEMTLRCPLEVETDEV